MSFLANIKTGKINRPIFAIVYGSAGVGKSTWAAQAPKPIFLDIERGTHALDVPRILPMNMDEIKAVLQELLTTKHEYETLVLDSLDHMELMINSEVMKTHQIDSMLGLPFGQAYEKAMARWSELLDIMKALREKMNIILIAHSTIRKVNDPTLPEGYDKFDLKLREKTAALLKEVVDCVLFASYDTVITKNSKDQTKASGTGARVLFCQGRPGHEAKNRFDLPYRLPLTWSDFAEEVFGDHKDRKEKITKEIEERIASLTDATTKKKAQEALAKDANDVRKLVVIRDRLRTIQGG